MTGCAERPFKTAVVPAAGMGTRFLPATKTVPKELLPVVDTPGIELVASEAAQAGAERLVIVTAPGKASVVGHFVEDLVLEEVPDVSYGDIGFNYALSGVGVPDTNGRSTAVLKGSTRTSGTGAQYRVIGPVQYADNLFGSDAYPYVEVKIITHRDSRVSIA